jgi:hypothetical protein
LGSDSVIPARLVHVRFSPECVAKLGEGWLVRNNRIVAKGFLNQWCDAVAILESILLAQTPEIVLQHIQVSSRHSRLLSQCRICAKTRHRVMRDAGSEGKSNSPCRLDRQSGHQPDRQFHPYPYSVYNTRAEGRAMATPGQHRQRYCSVLYFAHDVPG